MWAKIGHTLDISRARRIIPWPEPQLKESCYPVVSGPAPCTLEEASGVAGQDPLARPKEPPTWSRLSNGGTRKPRLGGVGAATPLGCLWPGVSGIWPGVLIWRLSVGVWHSAGVVWGCLVPVRASTTTSVGVSAEMRLYFSLDPTLLLRESKCQTVYHRLLINYPKSHDR